MLPRTRAPQTALWELPLEINLLISCLDHCAGVMNNLLCVFYPFIFWQMLALQLQPSPVPLE